MGKQTGNNDARDYPYAALATLLSILLTASILFSQPGTTLRSATTGTIALVGSAALLSGYRKWKSHWNIFLSVTATLALLFFILSVTNSGSTTAQAEELRKPSFKVNENVELPEWWKTSHASGDRFIPSVAKSKKERSIIGEDERESVGTNDAFPVSATVLVTAVNAEGEDVSCTGILYGVRSVATSAHCLYGKNGWNYDFKVSKSFGKPFYECEWVIAEIKDEFINSRNSNNDIGAIQFNCPIGEHLGWVSLNRSEEYLSNCQSNEWVTFGYPLDMWPVSLHKASGKLYPHQNSSVKHSIDTASGQSGSPIFCSNDMGELIAIHSSSTKDLNRASAISESHTDQLLAWSSRHPGKFPEARI